MDMVEAVVEAAVEVMIGTRQYDTENTKKNFIELYYTVCMISRVYT